MSVSQLVSHLHECSRRLSDLHARPEYVALTCAILRLEGAGGTVLYDPPFSRILAGRPFFTPGPEISHGDTFAVGFSPVADGFQADRIPAALAPVEAITREAHRLLLELPKPLRERLQLPDSGSWWRIVFHLAWHFPRPFLNATRRRLLSADGAPARFDEAFVQLYGTGGLTDLLPGLIYSKLEHDLCTSSEAAIAVIINALERYAQAATSAGPEAPTLSAEQRRAFDQLRAEFEAGAQIPMGMECKLLKLADSFESPPATEWAALRVGGCVQRLLTLSKRNDQQEIVQICGPPTEWFCQVAERAGNALPPWIPDRPILFDDLQCCFGGPCSVMNRDACERWIGFVFATIKQYAYESLRVTWGTPMGPLSYGFATIDRDLCTASVLAIDLARLTTAAAETANRERATCSPFSVPSMEEQGFQWAEEVPLPTSPANYTLGQLIEDLQRFGVDYCRAADQIREENPISAKHSRIQLGAHVSGTRAYLLAIPGFAALRDWVRSEWEEEISFAVSRRIVDTLVECSRGRLSTDAAERLILQEAVARLLEAKGASATDTEGKIMGDLSNTPRTPAQLLDAFAKAAAQYSDCPRMFAFLNSAREDGLVTVPPWFVPRMENGQPAVGQLNIGGTSKLVFGSNATFYGIGGARIASDSGNLNVGFVLYGVINDEAVTKFRELGSEAGVVVHVHNLVRGIQNYDSPLVLWSLIVFATLQGSAWLSQIDASTENPTLHCNPFAASVETLKRLLARNESLIELLLPGPDVLAPAAKTKPTQKRSTERGEGRAKLIAALTKHHKYAEGGCLNLEHIGNNDLAKAAGVSRSTASSFFFNEFEGHTKYRALCRDSGRLAAALKLLNNEFSPHDLYGRRPTGEDDRDDEGGE
jgi:hypothetical protein